MKLIVKDLFRKARKVGFFHLLSANILLQIAGFGSQIFLTRILSIEEIGIVRILQSFLGIFYIIAAMGINTAILKLCSERISDSEKKAYFFTGLRINIYTSIFIVILIFFIAFFNKLSDTPEINRLMTIFIFQVPFIVLINYGMAFLQSQKKVKVISKLQSLTRVFVIIASLFSAFLFGINGYVIGIVISNVLSFVIIIVLFRKSLSGVKTFKIESFHKQEIIRLGGFSFGTSILWQLILTSNIILASYLGVNSEQIAFYGIAHLLITTMMMIPFSLNQIMIPYLSEQTGNFKKINELLKIYQKRMQLIMIPLIVIAYFIVPICIPLIFGSDYENSILYFKILLIGLFCWSIYSPTNNVLTSIGKIDYNFYTYIYSFIIYLILNYFLIKHFNMVGAALAMSITFFLTIFINKFFYLMLIRKKSVITKDSFI